MIARLRHDDPGTRRHFDIIGTRVGDRLDANQALTWLRRVTALPAGIGLPPPAIDRTTIDGPAIDSTGH
jgi:hypothetical protein